MSAAVYLDYNATAKVRPEAAAAVARTLEAGGNPSSVHAAGRAARATVESARAEVARLAGVKPESLTFTSGGTEASALAIESAVQAGFRRLIIGATEHEAVTETARMTGLPVEVWPVDARGVADLDWLEARLADGPRALVCLMLANNETGVLQPVAETSALVRTADSWLHVDAVQAAGKIPIDFNALGADTMAMSAHKIGGPQGVGALAAGPRATLSRRLHGGGQERGRRSGTENVPGIAGFGAACAAALAGLSQLAAQSAWRDQLLETARAVGAVVMGDGAERLPQTASFALEGYAADLQVMALDLAGVMASSGAACSSGTVRPSRVIEAMGRPELATCAIRVSGGWGSTAEDWTRCGEVWSGIVARHKARRASAAA